MGRGKKITLRLRTFWPWERRRKNTENIREKVCVCDFTTLYVRYTQTARIEEKVTLFFFTL